MLTAEQVKSACDYYSSLPESDPMRNAYEIIVGLAVVVNSQKRALESQAAPGKVVAGEGWKQRLRKSLDDLMENHLCENSTALQGMKGLKALESILDEVTELRKMDQRCIVAAFKEMNLSQDLCRSDMIEFATALLSAATQPQKGKG